VEEDAAGEDYLNNSSFLGGEESSEVEKQVGGRL
jgi:hypothetical protein